MRSCVSHKAASNGTTGWVAPLERHALSRVTSAITGILLARSELSAALFARSSISARRAFHCILQLYTHVVSGALSDLLSLSFWAVLDNGMRGGTVTWKKPCLHISGSAQWPRPGQRISVPISDLNTALSSPLLVFGCGHFNASSTTSVLGSPLVFNT